MSRGLFRLYTGAMRTGSRLTWILLASCPIAVGSCAKTAPMTLEMREAESKRALVGATVGLCVPAMLTAWLHAPDETRATESGGTVYFPKAEVSDRLNARI